MAYFSNGSEGERFDEQCEKCKHGQGACIIYGIQSTYNYEAVNNKVATAIMNDLVKQDGTCMMFNQCKLDFELQKEKLF